MNRMTIEEYKEYQRTGKLPVERELATPSQPWIHPDITIDKLREKVKNKEAIYIPYNVPSSKNSREVKSRHTGFSDCCNSKYQKLGKGVYKCLKCGSICKLGTRIILDYSKTCYAYFENTKFYFIKERNTFHNMNLQYPVDLGFFYFRDSKRIFDGINAAQVLCDQMVKNDWVKDDNMQYIRHHDLGYEVNKAAAGVIIVPLEIKYKNFKNK